MVTVANTENHNPGISHSNHQIQNAREVFETQQRCFQDLPYPGEALRRQQLKALRIAIIKHKEKLLKAVSADYGYRSNDETLLGDILPTIMNIDYNLRHLRQWMKSEKRQVSMLFQPAQARVMYQPLGVVGIVSSWSFPILLTLTSLTAAIAAGNRVMLKPSENCPYTNRVLKEIVQDAFSVDEVCMIEGGASVSQEFTQLPFDHLMFTGSTEVGKKVMAAAALNLTPVTLELGGKSPAIIAPDVTIEFAVERILFGKTMNAGQSCVAPDYILCPEEKVDQLVSEMQRRFATFYPDVGNGDYTSVINDANFLRLNQWLQDAADKGAEIHPIAKASENQTRSMPLQLITKVNASMKVMQQEIFGPLLPIIGYRDLPQALQIVHAQTRPLALYLFTHDQNLEDQILRETHAGGVCINDAITHVAQEDLPFGGVGASGMGHYHAKEGFVTFSNSKAIFKRGKFNSTRLVFPPFGKWIHRLIYRWYLS